MSEETQARVRPTSITVISWIIIIMSLSVIFSILMYINPQPSVRELLEANPIPISGQIILNIASILIGIVCGIMMLKGRKIGRTVYLAWTIIGLIIGLITSPMKWFILPGVISSVVIFFFLFRPKANDFFNNKLPLTKKVATSSDKRIGRLILNIFGVLFMIFGGFIINTTIILSFGNMDGVGLLKKLIMLGLFSVVSLIFIFIGVLLHRASWRISAGITFLASSVYSIIATIAMAAVRIFGPPPNDEARRGMELLNDYVSGVGSIIIVFALGLLLLLWGIRRKRKMLLADLLMVVDV